MAEPRDKAEGWYLLHDLRTFDWGGWNSADERTKERAVGGAVEYVKEVSDPEEGDTAVFGVVGDEADLMMVHVRPKIEGVDAARRRFERTAFADFTDVSESYISVAEVGGYTNGDIESDDLSGYARSKLFPDIPDKDYVSFYPMSRKREPEQNWYETDLDHRHEMMNEHRESGEAYAGKIKQIIAGSIGIDRWEWTVDLFTDDMKHAKSIVYEMRFDEATARYSEFGPFYTGMRLAPEDIEGYVGGERVPSDGCEADDGEEVRDELADLGVYGGQPHGEDVFAVVLYSEENAEELADEVDGMRSNFEHYDTHIETTVYDDDTDRNAAVVSIWDNGDSATTAAGYLNDLPGVVGRAGDRDEGFGTMGMFYTVKPEHREEFVERFDEVGELLDEMEGHVETRLLENVGDENEMFIASDWESKDDAMEFFRSEEFTETVSWGREVLADRPRHVFLA